jgi:poly(beta-D-mannuronate) C5 epimerase
VFKAMNARIALTMLSQGYGPQDNSVVLIAQPEGQRALAVMSGRATPDSLKAALAAEGLQPPDGERDLTLRVPVIVMPGAALTLSPGDTLWLDRVEGAFIANFGRLEVTGATIAGTTAPNLHARSFAPFVATAQAGSVIVRDARISGLGFGRTSKFSGFGVLLSALRLPGQQVQISGTVFSDIRSVMLTGADDAAVTGNLFTAMRGPALVVARGARSTIAGNIFTAPMATNAIVIDHGALGARVTGNLVLGGDRAGIVVRNDSDGATVAGNVVWNRGGGGITVAKSDCGLVTRNLVVGNEQKGIEIRTSDGSRVLANRIYGDQSSALWVSAQQDGAVAVLADNVLAENATGLASASGGGIWLKGNDFTAQYLRFLGGDLAPQSPVMATNMDGRVAMFLTASGGQAQAGPPPDRCDS